MVSEWCECKLGDVVTLKRGYDLPSHERRPGPYPVVSSSGITDHHDETRVRGPGVVTGRFGTLGQVFFLKDDFWPLNTSLYVQDFKGNLPRFVAYLLAQLGLGSQNAAAAVPGVNRNHLHALRVRVPPLRLQERIAGILSAHDDLIENNLRRIRILEEMARALYREWFVDLRFPGHAAVPRVDSPLGRIPQGWDGTMGDSATMARMNVMPSDFPDEEFDHFSIPAFDETRLPAIETGATILSGKHVVDSSCTLLSKLNPRIPRVWLPYPSGVRRAIASTEFIVLRPLRRISREFLFLRCCSADFVGRFAGHALGTSTSHQRVKPDDLLSMPTIIPSEEVMHEFTGRIAPMLDLAQSLRTRNLTLRRTRDLLLPRLLSGQLAPPMARSKSPSDRRV
ncbi:MAG: restriction endonuclease subunit S [Candidatus Eisenbacteria bacterium]|nr:restriction endonuclease subunit S [Candidatus Eisenbacteria bacterium]